MSDLLLNTPLALILDGVQKVWTPSFLQTVHCMANPPFYLFSGTPTFDIFFENIAPRKYGINPRINSLGKAFSSCLEGFKTTFHVFCKKLFLGNTKLRFESKYLQSLVSKIGIINESFAE